MKKQIIADLMWMYKNSECRYSGNESVLYVHNTRLELQKDLDVTFDFYPYFDTPPFKVIVQS